MTRSRMERYFHEDELSEFSFCSRNFQTLQVIKHVIVDENKSFIYNAVFSVQVFFRECCWLTGQQGKGLGEHPYPSLPLPPTHKYSDIFVLFYHLDGYLVFLIAAHVVTRLFQLDCCSKWFIHLREFAFYWFDWLHLLDITHLSVASSECELAKVLETKPIRYLTRTYELLCS